MKTRIIAAALAAGFCMAASATEYTLQGPPDPTGSTQRPVIATASYPLDKRWEQLDAADMRQLRGQYQTLADNEEPPFPEAGMKPIFERLHALQTKNSLEGDMYAVVLVDENGNGRSVSYLQRPFGQHIEAITKVLESARYKPASCAGTPCAMEFPLHITFKLKQGLVF